MSKDSYNFRELREQLIAETKEKIASSIGPDFLITQAIGAIGELDRVVNILAKRLKEWYELHNPEALKGMQYEDVVTTVLENKDKTANSMGGDLEEKDIHAMTVFAERINQLFQEKEDLTEYIRVTMESFCPNVLEVCGPLIGAKLLSHKGTLREMAFLPASTIQMLGAEKALFRHIKTNARSPKYGYILQHQAVQKAKNRGKAARQLANKISIAAKKDYFSNEGNTA